MTLISVRPAELRAAAANLCEAAALLARSCQQTDAERRVAPDGGWLTAPELCLAAEVWSAYLRQLRANIEDVAERLSAAATMYAAGEREANDVQRPGGVGFQS
jgi:hypothetical protein